MVWVTGRVARDGDGEAIAKALPRKGDELRRRAEPVGDGPPAAAAVGRRVAPQYHQAADACLRSIRQDGLGGLAGQIGAGEVHLHVEPADRLGGDEGLQGSLAGRQRPCDIDEEGRRLRVEDANEKIVSKISTVQFEMREMIPGAVRACPFLE